MNPEDNAPSPEPIQDFMERFGHVDFGTTGLYIAQGTLKGAVEILKTKDIFEGYQKWGPGQIGQDLGNEKMVQCRSGLHEDNNPSMSINVAKGVFTCFSCEWSGDIFDLAAKWFELEDYKVDTDVFVVLLEEMLISFGIDPNQIREQNAFSEDPHPVTLIDELVYDEEHGEVLDLSSHKSEAYQETQTLKRDISTTSNLDWQTILGRPEYEGTFLRRWMDTTTVLQSPDEYLFWVALVGISTVMAKRVYMQTSDKVYANFQVVLMGQTGIGKSRSVKPMKQLLRETYLDDDYNWMYQDHVVKVEGRTASGEALFDLFLTEDPMTAEKFTPGAVLLDVDEFSSLMAATGSRGATLSETFIEIVDGPDIAARTSIGRGRRVIRNPFLSTITSSQPDAIGAIVDSKFNRSGFANRWVFVEGTPKPHQKLLHQAQPNLAGLSSMVAQLHAKAKKIDDAKMHYRVTEGAGDAWDDMEPTWRTRMTANNGELFARFPLHTLRVALILAFCQNGDDLVITEQTMLDAIHIVEANATMTAATSDSIVSTEEQWYRDTVLQEVIAYREETNAWPNKTTIRNRLPSNKRQSVKVAEAITHLCRTGLLEEHSGRNEKGVVDKRKKNYRVVE